MNRLSIIYLSIVISLMALAPSPLYAGSLPPLIDFQSVLLDEGGNLLPSGPTTIQFQILDENRTPIYSESQSVDVVKGAAAALIGNGTNANGAPTGGIPEDIFATGAPRYLQVQVGEHAPEDPMTIVPVPYSQWSSTCATVADSGVKSTSIANGAVQFEALAPDVISKLADALSKSQGVLTAQTLGSSGGATQVGVTEKFINSGASTVQGVLQDIDLSVKKGQETDTFLTSKLNQEVTDRVNAVAKESSDRSLADTSLQSQITPIQSTLQDINNIPGTLSLGKVETSAPPPSDLNMGGHRITSLGAPLDTKDAVTKEYVDKIVGESLTPPETNQAHIYFGSYVGTGSYPLIIAGLPAMPKILTINRYDSISNTQRNTNLTRVSDAGAGDFYMGWINNPSDGPTNSAVEVVGLIKPNSDGFTIVHDPNGGSSSEPAYNENGKHFDFIAQW